MHAPSVRQRAWVVGGVGSALALATALLASRGDVFAPELLAARFVYDLPSWTTRPLRGVMQFGTRPTIVVVVVLLIALGRRWAAAAVGVGALVAWWAANLAKDVVDRQRPTAELLGWPIRDIVHGEGFPSTHSAVAASLAAGLILSTSPPRWVAVLVLVLAFGTLVARLHLGVHWPLDVLGGTAIGAAVAAALAPLGRRPS